MQAKSIDYESLRPKQLNVLAGRLNEEYPYKLLIRKHYFHSNRELFILESEEKIYDSVYLDRCGKIFHKGGKT